MTEALPVAEAPPVAVAVAMAEAEAEAAPLAVAWLCTTFGCGCVDEGVVARCRSSSEDPEYLQMSI